MLVIIPSHASAGAVYCGTLKPSVSSSCHSYVTCAQARLGRRYLSFCSSYFLVALSASMYVGVIAAGYAEDDHREWTVQRTELFLRSLPILTDNSGGGEHIFPISLKR